NNLPPTRATTRPNPRALEPWIVGANNDLAPPAPAPAGLHLQPPVLPDQQTALHPARPPHRWHSPITYVADQTASCFAPEIPVNPDPRGGRHATPTEPHSPASTAAKGADLQPESQNGFETR